MLDRLLEIKCRRERGIRANLVRLKEEEEELIALKHDLRRRRVRLHADRVALAAEQGVYGPLQLETMRGRLAKKREEDERLQMQLKSLAVERVKLKERQLEEENRLRRNLLEQEKLTLLMEELL